MSVWEVIARHHLAPEPLVDRSHTPWLGCTITNPNGFGCCGEDAWPVRVPGMNYEGSAVCPAHLDSLGESEALRQATL